jgi:hypothetical protein
MTKLIELYKKLLDAEKKLAEAEQYSDWSKSISAYRASATRASQKLMSECRFYLGHGYPQQDLINLLTKIRDAA